MESLYRKYRPLTFDSVVGQQHIVSTLEHAVTEGRISHAYLFCGPRGTGKTTMARILAKALLCEHADAARAQGASGCLPDGTCPECQAIAEGTHPDVYELDAASRTGVDSVRDEIISSVNFAPVRGAYKVYIIDEVHMLTTAAFNALLKTLEEPPAHVVFILCTTDPQKILETILSRCQRFDFHRISNEDIVGRLRYICGREGFDADDEALEIVARHARGGMRDALSTLEQLSVFGDGAIRVGDARALLGEVADTVLAEFSRGIAARDVVGLFGMIRAQVDGGNDLLEFTRDLVAHIRDVYTARMAGGDPELFDGTPDEVAALVEEARLFESSDRLARVLTVLDDAAIEMRSASDARLVLEIACTRLARPESDLTLEALAERLDRIEAQLAAGVPSAPMGQRMAAGSMAGPRDARKAAPGAAPAASAGEPPSAAPAPRDRQQRATERPAAASAGADDLPWNAPAKPSAPPVSSPRSPERTRESRPAAAAPTRIAPAEVAPAAPQAPASADRPPVSRPVSSQAPKTAPSQQVPQETPVKASSARSAAQVAASAAAPTPAVSDEGELQRKWREVVKRVTAAQASRGALLQASHARSDDGARLTVGFPKGSNFAIKMLGRPDSHDLIMPIVSAVFGARTVDYVMDGDAAQAQPAQKSEPAPAAPASQAAAPHSPERPRTSSVEFGSRGGSVPAGGDAPAASTPRPVQTGSATAPAAAPKAPAAGNAPVADQMSGPTIVPESDVDADRRAWEEEQVPYDDAMITGYMDEEPPFEEPVGPAPVPVPAPEPVGKEPQTPSRAAGQGGPASAHPAFAGSGPFSHPGKDNGVPQSEEEAKAMLNSIFGNVVYKEDEGRA